MHITLTNWFRLAGASRWQQRMAGDADQLLAEFGPAAYGVAADRSWREDVGLLKTSDPGHWSRVTLEIGRRLAATQMPLSMAGVSAPQGSLIGVTRVVDDVLMSRKPRLMPTGEMSTGLCAST